MGDGTEPARAGQSENLFAALSGGVFRKVWAASVMSNLGSVVQVTAAAWVMATLTSSPTMVALVQTAVSLPAMLLALLAGSTADIYDRKKQMLLALLIGAVAALTLTVLHSNGSLTPWVLLLLTALIGVSTAFYSPAWQSTIGEMVPKKHFVSAISANNFSINSARAIGPAFGAELLVWFGAGAAFLFNGISFVLLGLALLGYRPASPKRTLPPESIWRAMADGLRYAAISRPMWSMATKSFAYSFAAAPLLALPPVVVLSLSGDARWLGILLACFGVGATSGAFAIASLRAALSVNGVFILTAFGTALSMALLGLSDRLMFAAASLFVAGFFWVQAISTFQITVQTSCPKWVTGRMVSILATSFSAGLAGGSITWGWLADVWAVSLAMYGAAAAMVIVAGIFYLLPHRPPTLDDLELQDRDLDFKSSDIDPLAGPVQVDVRYEVERQSADAFRTALFAYRRTRVRDGARQWLLSQQIDDNSVWIERFEFSTWADYLRFSSRRVVSDKTASSAVIEACRGEPNWQVWLKRTPQSQPITINWQD